MTLDKPTEALYKATIKKDIRAVKKSLERGKIDSESFYISLKNHLNNGNKIAMPYLFEIFEAILEAGYDLPKDTVALFKFIGPISSAPIDYRNRQKPLLEKLLTIDPLEHPAAFLRLIENLIHSNNLESLKLFIPPTTTEETVSSWYAQDFKNDGSMMQSLLYTCINKSDQDKDIKWDCLEYLLDVLPERSWRAAAEPVKDRKDKLLPGLGLPLTTRAARFGNIDLLHKLLDKQCPLFDGSVGEFSDPLLGSIVTRHPLMLEELLRLGLDPQKSKDDEENGLISSAIIHGLLDHISILVEAGCDIDQKNKWGMTPLMVAVMRGNEDTIRHLLTLGATIEAEDHSKSTALMYSCDYDQLEVFKVLVKNGANLDAKDKKGKSPLHIINEKNGAIKAWMEEQDMLLNTAPANTQKKGLRL